MAVRSAIRALLPKKDLAATTYDDMKGEIAALVKCSPERLDLFKNKVKNILTDEVAILQRSRTTESIMKEAEAAAYHASQAAYHLELARGRREVLAKLGSKASTTTGAQVGGVDLVIGGKKKAEAQVDKQSGERLKREPPPPQAQAERPAKKCKPFKSKPKWKESGRCPACQEEEGKAEGRVKKVSSKHRRDDTCKQKKVPSECL
jgi:Skp family chaperone for outer membrane proteins